MSYINNFNPRRMVWFNQHEPKNKMDLWLSYNRHYTEDEDTSEESQTSDNPNQRACDLILKAWDCGAWIPIVGFNTTSANKIDIVEGNILYHPAIFTGQNPNDLYDAGTLGSLLSNSNFVTQLEWLNVFSSSGFTNAWNVSTHINNVNIRRAGTNTYGGVWASNFSTLQNTGFAKCQFKSNDDGNLYVSGSDIITAINSTSGSTIHTSVDIDFATTTRCGGILSDTHVDDPTDRHSAVQVRFVPSGTDFYDRYYNTHIPAHQLAIDVHQIIDSINQHNYDNPDEMSIVGGVGISVLATQDPITSGITTGIKLSHTSADFGKYLKLKSDGSDTEWVDLSSGTTYTAGVGIDIPTGTTIINANIREKESSPHQSGETFIRIVDNASGDVLVHNVTSNSMGVTWLKSYEYTEVTTDATKFVIALLNKNTNPVYIKLKSQNEMQVEASSTTLYYITTGWDFVASGIPSGDTLVTVLFGTVKIEPIKTLS